MIESYWYEIAIIDKHKHELRFLRAYSLRGYAGAEALA